jgi:hypothetical protein
MSASTALRLKYPRMTFARSDDGQLFFAESPRYCLVEVSFAVETGEWRFLQFSRGYGFCQEELLDVRDFLLQLNRLGGPKNLPPITNHSPEPAS